MFTKQRKILLSTSALVGGYFGLREGIVNEAYWNPFKSSNRVKSLFPKLCSPFPRVHAVSCEFISYIQQLEDDLGFNFPGDKQEIERPENFDYFVNFNRETKLPEYTVEVLSGTQKVEPFTAFKKPKEGQQLMLAAMWSANQYDYGQSGYVPALMAAPDNHADSYMNYCSTFRYANAAPQVPSLNTSAWNKLEMFVSSLRDRGHNVCVITGTTVSCKSDKKIGIVKDIPIPSFFYKIVIEELPCCDPSDRKYNIYSFMVPHIDWAYEDRGSLNEFVQQFLVPIEDIEYKTRYRFMNLCKNCHVCGIYRFTNQDIPQS